MAISLQEQTGNLADTLAAVHDAISSQLRVALPGIVQSFDAQTVTCVVQPTIKGQIQQPDGSIASVNYPLLLDVPVVFPRGGGGTLTFPVRAGDECVVLFADRCIDFWFQNGGVQEAVDPRQHDLSDAFAFIGPQSQARKISHIHPDAVQLRSDDGSAYVELHPHTGAVKIVAPGGLEFVTPEARFSAKVTITGLLTFLGGMVGRAASGIAAKITGTIAFVGTLTANGKRIDDSHTHSGVKSGNESSGGVN